MPHFLWGDYKKNSANTLIFSEQFWCSSTQISAKRPWVKGIQLSSVSC